MATNDISGTASGSQGLNEPLERAEMGNDEVTSIEVPPSTLVLLVRIERMDGTSIPETLMVSRQMNAFCVQYSGEEPYHMEFLNRYEVCFQFKEGTPISVIAGRLMNASVWQDQTIVVSCTIVPHNRVDSIVRAREGVRGAWLENGERSQESDRTLELRHQVEQLVVRETEMARNLDRCQEQQEQLTQIISNLGIQLQRMESTSVPNVAGQDYPTPQGSQLPNNQGSFNFGHTGNLATTNFQVKADLDIGKFSGIDPTPSDELTFEQWMSDVRAYQSQFPDFILLPAVRKSIQGRAKSVLRTLGPEYTIDQAIEILVKEYEGVASSDVIFKEFYQMKQEKQEKVQVFSVRLREALNRLTVRFPDRIPPGDEDRILCDRFFYGMKTELKTSVRHLFDTRGVTFGELLTAARRNELEEMDGKSAKIQSKSSIVEKETISPRSEGISQLKDQVSELTALMKAGNFPKKNNPPAQGKNKNDKKGQSGRDPNRRETEANIPDVRAQLTGPAANASGPFQPGQRPIQCYKCKGWGHPRRICPSRLNFSRGGNPRENQGNPPPESAETEPTTSTAVTQ